MGYHRAGFDVTGVDIVNHAARYPFRFVQGDAIRYLLAHGREFDAIHASPPCQAHTDLKSRHREDLDAMLWPQPKHVDLIPPTRAGLLEVGRPWIIENVPGAPLIDPVVLCGSMFGLGTTCVDRVYRQVRRHRLFESSAALTAPAPCRHEGQPIGIYGMGGRQTTGGRYKGETSEARSALRIGWASRHGLSQAIPPAYTEWLGVQLLEQLELAS